MQIHMSYQVIARKFRPQTFAELVGQDHVTTTLRNALQSGRLHHALLFTGPRGTGKTSSARILAKSLRCPNAVDFVPCNTCESCQDISVSRSVDVTEIDGASNNGVDAVRELRETVRFMPSSGKYKIYIIDEVHMLSTAAFNALLKTLEEPPEHVVFILATTEVHKLPATILSRLQRYDFRRIATRVIADQLQMICESEKMKADADAIWMVARQADGSMRDAQSLLEQVVTFAQGDLNKENVGTVLGLTDQTLLKDVLFAILNRKPEDLNPILQKFNTTSVNASLFMENLIQDLRHITMVRLFGAEAQSYIDRPDSDLALFKDLSSQVEEGDLQLLFDMALKGAQDVQRASEPRWVLEMVLLRMASAPRWMDFQKLQNILNGAGEMPSGSAPTGGGQPRARTPMSTPSSTKLQSAPAPSSQAHRPKLAADLPPAEKWFEFVQKVKKSDSLLGAKLEPLNFVKIENSQIELSVPSKMSFLRDQLAEKETQARIHNFLTQLWGPSHQLVFTNLKDAGSAGSAVKMGQDKAKQKEDELLEKAAQHPKVTSFNRIFQGQVKGFVKDGSPKEKT